MPPLLYLKVGAGIVFDLVLVAGILRILQEFEVIDWVSPVGFFVLVAICILKNMPFTINAEEE